MSVQGYPEYARLVEARGLTPRGGFHAREDDQVPAPPTGSGARTLLLVGNAGSSMWPAFTAAPEYADGRPDPLDRWSERVISELAGVMGARTVFPFEGPPYHPFQRWAGRAEPVSPSPMGTLIHPRLGTWHAYRGALVVAGHLPGLPSAGGEASPCLTCADQPCLNTCPAAAFRPDGFDVAACAGHLSGPNDCLTQGCLARNACPAGKPFQYVREQHAFHLAAFLRARRGGEP